MVVAKIRWKTVVLTGVAACGVALCALWMIFVHAPSPAEICEHKIELTRKMTRAVSASNDDGVAAQALIERLQVVCVKNAERKIRLRGKIQYAGHARCVMSAQSLEDAERC